MSAAAVLLLWAVRSSVLALIVFAGLFALRHRSASWRSSVATVGVCALVLLPIQMWLLPSWRWMAPDWLSFVSPDTPELIVQRVRERPYGWVDALVCAGYALPLLLRLWTLLLGLLRLSYLRVTSRAIDAPAWLMAASRCQRAYALKCPVRLCSSEEIAAPLSWGLYRPVVLIDRQTLMQEHSAAAVLGHELAHVERRDWARLLLGRLVVTLYWFNPLVWRLVRQAGLLAELAADERVLGQGLVTPVAYADTLLRTCRRAGFEADRLASGMSSGATTLSLRVQAILGVRSDDSRPRAVQCGAVCAIAVACGVMVATPSLQAHADAARSTRALISLRAQVAAAVQLQAQTRLEFEQVNRARWQRPYPPPPGVEKPSPDEVALWMRWMSLQQQGVQADALVHRLQGLLARAQSQAG